MDVDDGGCTIDDICINEDMYVSSSCELLGDTFSNSHLIHEQLDSDISVENTYNMILKKDYMYTLSELKDLVQSFTTK